MLASDTSLPLAFRLANLFDLKIEEIFIDDQRRRFALKPRPCGRLPVPP